MRTRKVIEWLCLGVLFSGCTYSVRPILTEKELVHDIDLNGAWAFEPDDGEPAQQPTGGIELKGFDNNSSYDFQVARKPEEPEDYVLRVGRLGGVTIAEFSRLEKSAVSMERGLPLYMFARLELQDDRLTLRDINDQECRKLLDEDKVPYFLPGANEDPLFYSTVILAPTKQIQEFVARRHDQLFTGPIRRLRKVPPADKPK